MERLDYLMVIAEEGNITRAAEKLYISQPALTKYVKKLEEEYGVRLLERSHHSVKLTKAGQVFLNEKLKIAAMEQSLRKDLKGLICSRVRISVGSGYSRGERFLTAAVERLLELHPNVDVDFRLGGELTLMDKVVRGKLDFAFGVLSAGNYTVEQRVLAVEMLGLLVPRSMGIVPEDVDPADTVCNPYVLDREALNGQNFIASDNSVGAYLGYSVLLSQYELSSPRVITSNSGSHIRLMIRQGLGYGCGYVSPDGETLRNEKGEYVLYRCTVPGLPLQREVSIAYVRENEKRKLLEELGSLLEEAYEEGLTRRQIVQNNN